VRGRRPDLNFAEGAGSARAIRFAGRVGGHAEVLHTMDVATTASRARNSPIPALTPAENPSALARTSSVSNVSGPGTGRTSLVIDAA